MEFYEVIKRRRSIRAYADREVEADKLDRLFEAVRQAPTACNLQPFRFLAVKDAAKRELIASVYPQPWFEAAPIIIVALGNCEKAWKRRNGSSAHTIDVAIAMEHLVLAAAAEELGTCWICAFDQDELHDKLGIGKEWEVVALTPLGYPSAPPPAAPKRKSLDQLRAVL